SVLLPQGKFAEFLVGDAASRRKILTELLGLELFERLRERAGEAHRSAQSVVEANERMLRTEYAGVTEERIQEAEAGAERAADLDRRLGAAERSVGGTSWSVRSRSSRRGRTRRASSPRPRRDPRSRSRRCSSAWPRPRGRPSA